MQARINHDPAALQYSLERKRLAREADDRAFASGEKSAAQLNRENDRFGHFSVVVDYRSAKRQY
jgi:hypothetical protein